MKYRPAVDELTILDGEQIAKLQHHVFALGGAQKDVVVHLQVDGL